MWSLLPWRSGVSREREQRAESLRRLTDDSIKQMEAASADNVAAAEEAKASILQRARQAAPLRPLLTRLIDRLSDDRFAHSRKDRTR
jgi:hypothetical protein